MLSWATTNLVLASCMGVALANPVTVDKRDAAFDYVIIGGGTAGLVLAERLSEDPAISVAVIEAGSYYQTGNPLLSTVPAGDVYYAGSNPSEGNTLIDWKFVTTPQAGANGRSIHYPRGKCLGGSSARNFMIYQRGSIGSYAAWADAVGDQSYSWNGLLPYFKKSIQFSPPSASRAANASAGYVAEAFDAAAGPLRVAYANFANPFSSYMASSMNEIGIPTTQDFNSGSLMGAQYCSSTINPADGKRDSSQTSFLNAAKDRGNLKVYDFTTAQRILFDTTKRAVGVRALSGFIPFTVTANKEVILSAGAFQSPQLLMLSGVGPAATLKSFGINVISDLSGVGQNMIDHIFFGPSYRVNVGTFTRLANDFGYVMGQFFGAFQKVQGPLTNPVADYLGWEKVPQTLRNAFKPSVKQDLATLPQDWPEIEYLSAPGYVGNFSSLPATQPTDGYQYATIMAALVAPFSRGNVTLRSTNAGDLPIINPNWLTSPTDQQVAVAAYKRLRQAFASKSMAMVLADKKEYFPGPSVQTDAQILDLIRNTLHTVYHASGTCKMGVSSDSKAVVDAKAKVFGVSGLRVVDASVFPLLPPGHPQSTVYAIAEKIAADIMRQ